MTEIVAREVLASHGLRATAQRVTVLSALMGEPGDVTAQSLHRQLRAEGHAMGLATVYRTLGLLAERGVIDTLAHGDGLCYRYCSAEHHHHLSCRRCHRVIELHGCEFAEWTARVAREHGFIDVSHTVELVGSCASCAGVRRATGVTSG